jgi:hypothetical protein
MRVCVVLVFLSVIVGACKETPPEPPPPKPTTISLAAEDASCTEAWLKATTTETPATVRLLRDGQRVSNFRLLTFDSLLLDEGLLPKRTYNYQLQKLSADSSVAETSASVQLTTMDTTSHNFTWQIDTLGTNSSVLYDVIISNDTLAYAVGEIFHRDSSENWAFFNLAKWNGREWTLQRIYYRGTNIIHANWILAFAENDIWISPYTHWNGSQWQEVPFDPVFSGVRTNKAWGTSSRDFYVVGDGGFIAHYNGSTWQRVESGTMIDLRDIYGAGGTVFASGWSNDQSQSILLKYQNGSCTTIWMRMGARTEPYGDIVSSVWTQTKSLFVSSNYGGFETITFDSSLRTILRISLTSFPYRIRGNARNDVVIVGDYARISHYNGADSHLVFPGDTDLRLRSVAMRNNLLLATGYRYHPIESKAIVIRGRR